jgi:hypothetical protein
MFIHFHSADPVPQSIIGYQLDPFAGMMIDHVLFSDNDLRELEPRVYDPHMISRFRWEYGRGFNYKFNVCPGTYNPPYILPPSEKGLDPKTCIKIRGVHWDTMTYIDSPPDCPLYLTECVSNADHFLNFFSIRNQWFEFDLRVKEGEPHKLVSFTPFPKFRFNLSDLKFEVKPQEELITDLNFITNCILEHEGLG